MTNYRNSSTRSSLRSATSVLPGFGNPIKTFALGIGIVLLVVFGIVFAGGYYNHSTDTTTIVDKERVCDSNGDSGTSCKYLVYTERGTYELTDSIFAGRWSSSDAYGRIKRCHRYEIESYGWRAPAFSMYPNIVKVTDLGRDKTCED